MEFEKLTAHVRIGRKKGTARRLRREGLIPAICYGPGADPVALTIDPKALSEALSGPYGTNTIIELTVTGEGAPEDSMLVMLQDHQYHPIRRNVFHADFLRVSLDQEVRLDVPFILEGRSVGEQVGGVLMQVFRELPVRCKPEKVPPDIRLDISSLNLGDLRKVSDLDLPEGVVVELEPNQTLASVTVPTVVAEPTEVKEEEEEEAAEAEEPTAE